MLGALLAGALLLVPLGAAWPADRGGAPGHVHGAGPAASPGAHGGDGLAGMPGAGDEAAGSIPLFFAWGKAQLRVVVVPPLPGPLYTGLPPAGMSTPLDLTGQVYLRAALDALEDWRRAIEAHALAHPDEAWLLGVQWDVRVLTQVEALDLPASLLAADIVVNFDETKTIVFGTSLNLVVLQPAYLVKVPSPRPACVAQSSKWFAYWFSYADMYNIVGHEFGHCLGILHADVAHDLMVSEYAHWPEPASLLHCPSNLDVRALTLSFGDALGHPPAGSRVEVEHYHRYDVRPGWCEPAHGA